MSAVLAADGKIITPVRHRYPPAVPAFRSLVIFALVLVVLRRFFAVPVSIGGSIVLTIVVSLIVAGLTKDKT